MKTEIVNVICPHCQKEQKQGILIKNGQEVITQNTCIHCMKEFLIHPDSRETTTITRMTKACYNCKYEENPTDENGELTEPCLTCVNYSSFIASDTYKKIISNIS